MIIHLKNARYLVGTYSKLKMRKFDPCKILRKFDSGNAYEVELPDDMDISPMFNVVDFYTYHDLDDEVVVPNDHHKK